MRLVLKAFFCCVVVCGSLLGSHQALACHDCGRDKDTPPDLASPDCRALKVLIHNPTAYTFVLDTTYPDSNPAYGAVSSSASISAFPATIPPGDYPAFYVTGTSADSNNVDEVDRTINYLATLNSQKTGAQFTMHLLKSSCNSSTTTCTQTDNNCYEQDEFCSCYLKARCHVCTECDTHCDQTCSVDAYGHETCVVDLTSCHGSGTCTTTICDQFFYDSGAKAGSSKNAIASSSVSTNSGVYITPDSTLLNTNYSFTANKQTVCQNSSDGNQPNVTEFTINASPIEQLTVMFPFNNQSPTAQLISNTVYKNLTAKNLGGLSTYFSVTPVEKKDTSTNTGLAFSALCNSTNCPQP